MANKYNKFIGLHGNIRSYNIEEDISSFWGEINNIMKKNKRRSRFINISLSKLSAETLSKSGYEYLDLSSLTSVSSEILEEIVKFKGSFLDLSGITFMDSGMVKKLLQFNGSEISLGLTCISPEIAKELAKFKGK